MTTLKRGLLPVIAVERRSATPLHRQIYQAFRSKIADGDLGAGQAVPSTRELAAELQVSRMPVLNAYAQLLAEGYFHARTGSGTFVSSSLPGRPAGGQRNPAVVESVSGPRILSRRPSVLPRYERRRWISSFGAFNPSQPALDVFPFRTWSGLLAQYARGLRIGSLLYGHALGLEELREAIAAYLRTARSVRCDPEQIMIVSGSQQALDITTRVLLDPGAAVWIEEPGYWLVQQTLQAAACRVVPVRVDEEGLDVAEGIRRCRKARAAYVAPSHQYPLGMTMSASRRLQLLDWAQTAGAWIVEDDYDSEYRYGSMPIASLQGLDRHSRVIYIGTFSKVLFPSLRLGYIVMPRDLVDPFIRVRRTTDICPSHTLQAVLARFIQEGHFLRHLRKMRSLYGQRRQVLIEAIRHEFGSQLEVLGGEAGMHVTVSIGRGMRDGELSQRAERENLWLWPLSPAYLGQPRRNGFLLGYGSTSAAELPAAVRHLKRILGR